MRGLAPSLSRSAPVSASLLAVAAASWEVRPQCKLPDTQEVQCKHKEERQEVSNEEAYQGDGGGGLWHARGSWQHSRSELPYFGATLHENHPEVEDSGVARHPAAAQKLPGACESPEESAPSPLMCPSGLGVFFAKGLARVTLATGARKAHNTQLTGWTMPHVPRADLGAPVSLQVQKPPTFPAGKLPLRTNQLCSGAGAPVGIYRVGPNAAFGTPLLCRPSPGTSNRVALPEAAPTYCTTAAAKQRRPHAQV